MLFRAISKFVYATEDLYFRVRRKIYERCLLNINNYPDITLNTELGSMHILDYMDHIREDGWFGGELEISIFSILYNINIATYHENLNNNNELIGYNFINDYNHNNDNFENRHLMILTNINNSHFRLGYDSHVQIDDKFKINNNINQKKLEDKDSLDLYEADNELSKILKNIEKFKYF